jgi:hypothetical protein
MAEINNVSSKIQARTIASTQEYESMSLGIDPIPCPALDGAHDRCDPYAVAAI